MMRFTKVEGFAFLTVSIMSLSACGSGGGTIASAPPTPTPTQNPLPSANDASVELLGRPATQELAVATRDDPIRIRFDASRNVYELRISDLDWSAVIDPPNDPAQSPNSYFDIAGQPQGYFSIAAHNRSTDQDLRYTYSNLASWRLNYAPAREFGKFVAFGTPTPASGVPLTGTAAFEEFATGTADVANNAWGDTESTPVGGKVNLTFDFAQGALSGSLALATECDCTKRFAIGPLAFGHTSFARGSQTYSGSFVTTVTGSNSFEGHFTGPRAEELIGSWTLPFTFDGSTHQAWGAWIAKRGD